MTESNRRQENLSRTCKSGVSSTMAKINSAVCWTDRFKGREEPALREMIEDPIMMCLMASDGLTVDSVLEIVNSIKKRQNQPTKELV